MSYNIAVPSSPESEPRVAYVIVTLHGKEQQRRKLDGPLTLGRSLEVDITLEDGAVSRQNSRIEPDGEKWVVVDLKSRNGTRVNGKEIERHELRQGDVIAVGHTKVHFHTGKFVGPRPSDPMAALLSETAIMMPASRREPTSRTLPTPKIGRVDVKPLPQQGNGHTPLPFTRPPARPIVRTDERE